MKQLHLFVILLVVCIITSCGEDSRMNNMVDDSVYVLKYELNEFDAYNWGEFEYKFIIVKSGVGQQSAEVELIIDEQYITEYNEANGMSYKLLPKEYYTIGSSRITIPKDAYTVNIPISFDTDGIISLQGIGNSEYVLPCKIDVIGSDIQSTDLKKLYSLLAPIAKEPYIEFSSPGITATIALDPESDDKTSGSSTVVTNYNNTWNLSFTLEADPSLVEEYNAANGTAYKALPEGAYTFDETAWKIEPKTNEVTFNFDIIKTALKDDDTELFGEYMLPVKISGVSQHGINPDKSIQYIIVSYQPKALDRTDWEVIEYSSENSGNEASLVLDGDLNTFWHNRWEGGEVPLPHYIIIDMKKEYSVMAMEISRRPWNMDTKTVKLELSTDGESFTQVGTIDYGSEWVEGDTTRQANISTTVARYLKITITESNRIPSGSIAEVNVKGIE